MTYSFKNPSDGVIRQYLKSSKIIAVVGLSDREDTTSNRVSREMQERGYTIVPVNPRAAGGNHLRRACLCSLAGHSLPRGYRGCLPPQ